MQAIVLDDQGRIVEVLKGKVGNGQFIYTRDAWWDFIGILSKKEDPVEFDYQKLIPSAKGKVAYYRWDGKNLTQLSFSEIQQTSNTVDYNQQWKIGEYAKAAVLKKPMGIDQILTWVAIIALIILVVGELFASSNFVKQIRTAIVPLNETVAQNKQLGIFLVNDIQKQDILLNKTEALLNLSIAKAGGVP